MFDDCKYYATLIFDGARCHNVIISFMTMSEFVDEFLSRFKTLPRIVSLLPISDNEYEMLEELVENDNFIFNGEEV